MPSLAGFSSVFKYNVKILSGLNLLAALAITTVVPVFFSLSFLSYGDMARIGELFLSTVGIVLFPFLCSIEEQDCVGELVYVRRTPHSSVFVLRIFTMAVYSLLMICAVGFIARCQGSSFPLLQFTAGVAVTAFFLGILGLSVANATGEAAAGYLAAFGWFALEWLTRGRYTKDFYLFSLMDPSFDEKYRLLAATAVLLILNILLVSRKSMN